MNKQTTMLIGVGAVAVAGYFIWKSTQKKPFANLTAPTGLGTFTITCKDGSTFYQYKRGLDVRLATSTCSNHGGFKSAHNNQ